MNRRQNKPATELQPAGARAPNIFVAVRNLPKTLARRSDASPHLLNIRDSLGPRPGAVPSREQPRRPRWKWLQKIDERVHLHDLRMRTLSIRPRGWRDFPPPSARTVPHAFGITLVKFFREHPLAELTVFALVHLLALIIYKTLLRPFRAGGKKAAAPAAEKRVPIAALLPAIPLLAAVPVISEKKGPTPPRSRPLFKSAFSWRSRTASFALLGLAFVLPVAGYSAYTGLNQDKRMITERGIQGVNSLLTAGNAIKDRQFEAAGASFNQAFRDFTDAQAQMGSLANLTTSAAASLPFKNRLSSARNLLVAGREIAVGGADLSNGLAALDCALDPAAKIASLRSYIASSLPHLERAAASLAQATPEALPEKYRADLAAAQARMPEMVSGIKRGLAATELLQAIMGVDSAKRFLVIFQNNAELRPTGGFIGSFALVDIDRGRVKKVEIPGGGSYDLKGGLRVRLASPRPLHLINPNWEFQDANWFADFPTSAKKAAWFYEKSGGPTTDGVIAVNASFLEKVLELTGPVSMPEYGKTIDAQNFYFETQKAVEIEYDRTQNQPKKFIADLAPKILERILAADQETSMKLLGTLDQSLARKELQFWFRDEITQTKASSLGWTGEVKSAEGDYLYVVHTNIAGQKTDLVMKDDIDHSVKILPDGTGIVTLTVKRSHTGAKNALFSGVRNVDYLRVYVPYGSTLVEAGGFDAPDPKLFKLTEDGRGDDPDVVETEKNMVIDRASGMRITTESGKTVFGNWVQTDPGQTSVLTMVYKLPPGTIRHKKLGSDQVAALYDRMAGRGDRQGLSYSLLLQKQSGANPANFTSHIDFPRGYRVVWQAPERQADERGRLSHASILEEDVLFGAVAQTN